ncbi:MAG: DUF975 family protein [Clostridium sp.]|nr:DUF975 family protein [Clostridium sp.]
MERVLIKEKSKELLKGRWLNAIGAVLIFSIISSILGFIAKSIPIIGIIISFFLTSYIGLSFNNYFIKITETDKKVKYMDCFIDLLTFLKTIIATIIVNIISIIFLIISIILFSTFSNNQVINVITFSLCLLVIGLVVYCYLTFFTLFYIFRENKEIRIIYGIKEAMSISKGFKLEYLIFLLSFLGWYILSVITFGIGFLWSVPYFLLAQFLFYKNMLKRK